jgi:2',3'-cyclic-nucleotide 2'-phosphodiesterase/3'-nucleotidase
MMLHPFSAELKGPGQIRRICVIMETTDIHVNVLPYDYYADKAATTRWA